MDIKAVANNSQFALTFNDYVDGVLARELKYAKDQGKKTATGDYVGVLQFDTDWIKNVEERIAVQYVLNSVLNESGIVNEDGRPKLFTPIVRPFHVNDDGTPATQLRIFYYRGKMEKGDMLKQSTILVRCEPYGTEVAFDVSSKYATNAQATVAA